MDLLGAFSPPQLSTFADILFVSGLVLTNRSQSLPLLSLQFRGEGRDVNSRLLCRLREGAQGLWEPRGVVHTLIWEVREGAPEEMASTLNFEECMRFSR